MNFTPETLDQTLVGVLSVDARGRATLGKWLTPATHGYITYYDPTTGDVLLRAVPNNATPNNNNNNNNNNTPTPTKATQ